MVAGVWCELSGHHVHPWVGFRLMQETVQAVKQTKSLSLSLSQLEPRLPVGTPEYIAPEVLTSLDSAADYGVCCDWWSLGIIAYELLFEVTPFEGKSTTHTYGNIMNFKVGAGREGACKCRVQMVGRAVQ